MSRIHSLYSTSNHGSWSVTHTVIHAFTATLIVSSFHHLFIFYSSYCPFFIFLKYLDSYVEVCHVLSLNHFFIIRSFVSFSSLFHHFVIFLHILQILTKFIIYAVWLASQHLWEVNMLSSNNGLIPWHIWQWSSVDT